MWRCLSGYCLQVGFYIPTSSSLLLLLRGRRKGDLENEVDFAPPISIKRSHQAFLGFYVLCNIITKAYEHKKQGCGSDFSRGGGSNRVTNSSLAPSSGANGKRTWIRGWLCHPAVTYLLYYNNRLKCRHAHCDSLKLSCSSQMSSEREERKRL